MVQPFTVIVLAEVEPGPPAVDEELDTEPPPACTRTLVPPAELLLDSALLPLPVVAEEPAAEMLPSAWRSTVTLQVSPVELRPVLTTVSAYAVPPIAAATASAT